MSSLNAVVGLSGTGKSTSLGEIPELNIKGLNPKETVIINTMGKPLPFRGWRKKYNPDLKISEGGNYLATTDSKTIIKVLNFISDSRNDIKNIVLDDTQYIMSDKFMADAKKKGYDKFNDLAKEMYDILNTARQLRNDIDVFCLTHSEESDNSLKIKTIGKMLDDKITLEGLFTVVLYTHVEIGSDKKPQYSFVTNFDGIYPAKSPIGTFDELHIPNDLGYVKEKIEAYNNGE